MHTPSVAVIDIETTGLDRTKNIILEVGIILLNRDLEEIAVFEEVVADRNSVGHLDWLEGLAMEEPNYRGQEPWKGAKYVHEMHQNNGLANYIRARVASDECTTLGEISNKAADWLRSYNVGRNLNSLPMCGSTVHFDRGFIETQMPQLNEQFHYRNIDVSTLKGLVDLYRNDIATIRNVALLPARTHRALSDCRDSVAELKFYLEHLFAKGN